MPEAFALPPALAELDAAAERILTPCGEGEMVWRVWGEGEPLLLVHGASGSWLTWQNNIAGLARHRRLLVPDLPGFGDSAPVLPLDSVPAHVEAVAEGLHRLLAAGEVVDIAAFSAGALLACHLDVAHPDLVRRVVIIAAGGFDTPHFMPQFVGVRGLEGEAIREANRYNLSVMMYHDAALIDDGAIAMNMFGGPRMRSQLATQVLPDGLLKVLPEVKAPCDVIWPEFDAVHPDPELHLGLVRGFQPEAQLRVVAKAGHWCCGEQPELFNAALLDLLAQPVRPRLS